MNAYGASCERTSAKNTLHVRLNIKSPDTTHCPSHRELADSSGVLQQLLKGDGPAQHAVGRGGLPARSPWKAGAAASTAPCRHVQLYHADEHKTHPFIRTLERDQEWDRFSHFLVHRHVSVGRNGRCTGLAAYTLVFPAYLHQTPPGSVNRETER